MPRFPAFSACMLLALLPAAPVTAQEQTAPLRVYVSCNTRCDHDFFRTELSYLEWMRDRADADVHVLIGNIETGGGGQQYELRFVGLGRFGALTDTLTWFAESATTDDEVRRAVTRTLELGLVRYLLETPLAGHLSVDVDAPAEVATAPVEDPWNAWIFNVYGELEAEGESSAFGGQIYTGVSAQRITDDWKVSLAFNNGYDEQRFDVDSVTQVKRIRRDWGASTLLVRSLGGRFAAGILGSIRSNTFENLDLSIGAAPALEYNFYPYGDYTTRYLTLLYTVGVNATNYQEITIHDKLEQTLVRHTLSAAVGFTQPWGDINLSAEGLQYLHDLSRRRLVISGGAEVSLFRGLSLDMGGDFSWIADQLSLRKRDLSDEEILLQGGQLATDFSYELRVGLSYSFGSRSNRSVNPRFDRTPGEGGYVF